MRRYHFVSSVTASSFCRSPAGLSAARTAQTNQYDIAGQPGNVAEMMMTADNLPLRNTLPGPAEVERPLAVDPEGHWGSDVIAGVLRALDLPYAALNPGASYRGLHD